MFVTLATPGCKNHFEFFNKSTESDLAYSSVGLIMHFVKEANQ